jgi:hypothetical protein
MRLQPKSEARLIATEAPTAGPTPAPTPDVVAFTRTDAAEVRKSKASGGDRNLYGGTLSDATDKSVLPAWYQCGDNSGMVRIAFGFYPPCTQLPLHAGYNVCSSCGELVLVRNCNLYLRFGSVTRM